MRSHVPLVLIVLTSLARADDTPVLHEYVPDARDSDIPEMIQGGGGAPAAIVYDGEILPPPEGGALQPDERPMTATPGNGEGQERAGHRSPTFRPDRVTALEGTLGYFTVFTPAIAPFKRVSALDGVSRDADGVPVLGVAQPAARPVEVTRADAAAPDGRPRDRFWGSVVLDFATGPRVPFPSVSPESRLLSLRSEPEAALRIEKDGADNYYAVSDHGAQLRVVFLMDAPRSYFNAEAIPEAPVNALESEVFPLDESIRADALRFAGELGIARDSSLPRALARLTEHFRSFLESDEPPPVTESIYLDLARGMRGVCRHRAYGFVITAHALGIPARFVQNEAHAWVEVKLPELGWMRVDLGGAANALEAHGAEDRPVYRAEQSDPLPRPEPYRRSYSQLRGDVRGLRADASSPPARATESVPMSRPPEAPPGEEPADPIEALFSPEPEAAPAARPLRLVLDSHPTDVFRGRVLTLSGRALDPDGQGAAGLRIEVLMQDRSERLLGVTVSREDGSFHASVGVPPDLQVGEYRLVVRSPGDARFYSAVAR